MTPTPVPPPHPAGDSRAAESRFQAFTHAHRFVPADSVVDRVADVLASRASARRAGSPHERRAQRNFMTGVACCGVALAVIAWWIDPWARDRLRQEEQVAAPSTTPLELPPSTLPSAWSADASASAADAAPIGRVDRSNAAPAGTAAPGAVRSATATAAVAAASSAGSASRAALRSAPGSARRFATGSATVSAKSSAPGSALGSESAPERRTARDAETRRPARFDPRCSEALARLSLGDARASTLLTQGTCQ